MKRASFIVALLLQVFLALSPFLPGLSGFWRQQEPSVFYARLTSLVAVEFALVWGTLWLLLNDELRRLASWRRRVSKRFNTSIERISDRDFYADFLAKVQSARHSVDIAYLAPNPPNYIERPYREAYYRQLLSFVRANHNISVRRIVRRSPENVAWVAELMRELRECPNVSIALLEDRPQRDRMPLALSVQIVDNRHVWLVALASHEPLGPLRDVYVESEKFRDAMRGYYDRLWGLAECVLENGQPTQAGESLLERQGRT